MRPLRRGMQVQFSPVWLVSTLVVSMMVLVASALPASATAANLFTLDSQPDSIGPVVVDQSGNGYVAWLHKSSPTDTVMFCKLAPGAKHCAHPLGLPVTLLEVGSVTDTPFPVLGPGSTVFVVAPSYDTNQMVVWESGDGGASFSAPWVATAGNGQASVCRVETNLDDVVPFNADGAEYNPSQGTATLPGGSANNLEFEMSSANPFINWTFAFYGQGCVEPYSALEHSNPGQIPYQYFPFSGGAVGGQESSLGWAGGGSAACARVAPGDEVEAFAGERTTPPTVRFYPLERAHRSVLDHGHEPRALGSPQLGRPDHRVPGRTPASGRRRSRAVHALRRRSDHRH